MEEVEHEPGSEGDGKSIHAGMERLPRVLQVGLGSPPQLANFEIQP